MPAQKDSPSAKRTKSALPTAEKPAWVSDELWQLSQNTANLIELLRKADDHETESGCSHAQVASSTMFGDVGQPQDTCEDLFLF